MKKSNLAAAILSAGILLMSCSKGDVAVAIDKTNDGSFKIFTEGNITTVQNLMADTIIGLTPGVPPAGGIPYGAGKFTFFSIENKTLVSNADSATAKWDVAFRGTTILVNNGTSGPGNGGAFVLTGSFDNLAAIPTDSVFRTDNAPVYAITTGSGKGWYNYNGPVNLLTPLPGRILVIRTASGKYAKIEIQNYYKGGVTPASGAPDNVKLTEQRYYAFRFTYQPNGTKNF
jgi:HmuY protein